MKTFIKELIGWTLVKWFFLRGKKPDRILSITCHFPSVKMFTDIVDQLHRLGYEICSLEKIETLLAAPVTEKPVAFITLDDAWRSNLDLLPVLETKQVPIAIFVPTEPVDSGNYWWEYARKGIEEKRSELESVNAFKQLPDAERKAAVEKLMEGTRLERSCLNRGEIKKLNENKWITLGSHTVTHPILDKCTDAQQVFELEQSRVILESWTGKPVRYFAYPNGDYDKKTLSFVKNAGYTLGFTDRHGQIRPPVANLLEIPRNSLNDNGGYFENYAKLLGIWQKAFGEN